MQTYICEHCDSLECDTSVCPVCGGKTTLIKSVIFYCDKCQCPTYSDICEHCHSKCRKIGSDIRPVFSKERLLIETLLDKPFGFADASIWCVGANNYVIDGKKVKLPFQDFRRKSPDSDNLFD